MQLKRKGGLHNHGWTTLVGEQNKTKTEWDKTDKCVKLSIETIRDVNKKQTYSYDIVLSIDDITKIVTVLAEKGIADCQSEVQQKFLPRIDKLIKLLMCSVGIVADKSTP